MKSPAALDIERAPLVGVTLIEASAGTGKTHTIASLFVRLLLEADLTLPEILVVTYTRAATAELRLRIRKRLGQALEAFERDPVDHEAPAPARVDPLLEHMVERARAAAQTAGCKKRLVDALRSFDEAAIFTIHGFCQRVLKRHAFESGVAFELELREDQALLMEEVVCDFWADRLSHASPQFVAVLEHDEIDVDSLVRLIKRATADSDLLVIPEAHPEPTHALEHAYALAGAQVAELWQQHAPEIECLLAQPGLHASYYGAGKLRSVFDDVLPRAAQLPACELRELRKGIAYLTPEGMKCNKGVVAPSHAFFEACGRWWAAAGALLPALRQHEIALQRELLEFARAELAKRSDEAGSLGFDDLLVRLSAALQGPDGAALIRSIRRTHKAALIDEFQDTDPVQCDVFRRIYAAQLPGHAPGSLFLIGDPKQAIYAFRGADVFAYIAAARSAVDRSYTLSTNYRSDPSLLRGIDSVFARARAPFVFPEISYRSVSAAPTARDRLQGAGSAFEILLLGCDTGRAEKAWTKLGAEAEVPKRLAAEIGRLLASQARLDGKPIEPRQIAVLCRTNLQAQRVQAALRERAIPSVLDGDASVFDSSMADELARWLWAMVEPSDADRVRAALATTGIGLSADELLALEDDERSWDSWVGRFHTLHELWHTAGFMRALHTLCDQLGVAARLLALLDGERRYTDLMHLAELLHTEAQQTRKGPRALLDWYRRMRAGDAQRVGMALEDVQIRLESDARAVTLTTIHKSKGLQFPIVYCPFLWDGTLLHKAEKESPRFHDRDHADRPTLVLKTGEAHDPAQLAAAEREALAENLRLLYVALTRAEHRLSIVWGRLGSFEHSALAYLLHQTDAAEGDLRQRTAGHAKQLDDAALQAELAQLAAGSAGAIQIRALGEVGSMDHSLDQSVQRPQLAPRIPKRRAADTLQISSFSKLAASERSPLGRSELVELDRDELTDAPSVERAVAKPVPLAEFPAGASFGHLIHAIYETLDFQVSAPSALHEPVAVALHDYAAPRTWTQPLSAAVFDTLHTRLDARAQGLPELASVSSQQRLCELEFVFPVASAARVEPATLLSPGRLAQVLSAHARVPHERDYAARLAKLRFVPFAGFLRGFMDLVVEHAGRFFILDYKSNQLGPSPADYQPEALGAVMRRHHYVLQYLVYSVALQRYLALRLPGYDYDRHFGGVYYLFVRGMHPEHAGGTGVFFDRPERSLIEDLSNLLEPGPAP